MVTKGEMWGEGHKSGAWDSHTHTTVCKIDNQQGPAIEHRELCSIFCYDLDESEKEYAHTYNSITLLYTWNYHNIVNQLYSNKIK